MMFCPHCLEKDLVLQTGEVTHIVKGHAVTISDDEYAVCRKCWEISYPDHLEQVKNRKLAALIRMNCNLLPEDEIKRVRAERSLEERQMDELLYLPPGSWEALERSFMIQDEALDQRIRGLLYA